MINSSSKIVKTVKYYQSNNILKKVKPYLGNMIDELNIHLTMKVNYMPSTDGDKRLMNSKSDNKEIMMGNEAD